MISRVGMRQHSTGIDSIDIDIDNDSVHVRHAGRPQAREANNRLPGRGKVW
jgi:hypothetical protein